MINVISLEWLRDDIIYMKRNDLSGISELIETSTNSLLRLIVRMFVSYNAIAILAAWRACPWDFRRVCSAGKMCEATTHVVILDFFLLSLSLFASVVFFFSFSITRVVQEREFRWHGLASLFHNGPLRRTCVSGELRWRRGARESQERLFAVSSVFASIHHTDDVTRTSRLFANKLNRERRDIHITAHSHNRESRMQRFARTSPTIRARGQLFELIINNDSSTIRWRIYQSTIFNFSSLKCGKNVQSYFSIEQLSVNRPILDNCYEIVSVFGFLSSQARGEQNMSHYLIHECN